MRLSKSLRLISLLSVMLFSFGLIANAQRNNRGAGRWEYLGQSQVDGIRDHDNISVNTNAGFQSIQLRVQGGTIEFQKVVVHFENGADTEVEVRDRIRAGGMTRALDLPGDRRRISSVEIWYRKGNWRSRKPGLKLYGFHSNANAQRDNQGGNQSNDQRRGPWEYLGESRLDGIRDHDAIRVNARGGFRTIQLQVQGGAIEFQKVVVHFENGADTEVEVRDRISAGGKTRAIDLPGDQRRISNVEIWYSRGNWGWRKPGLKLYGQR
ncbi:MAG: hypothetical protein ABI882_19855 [Acidobacteriota bacterium]